MSNDSNDFSFLYDDLSNDSIFDGMDNNSGSQLEDRTNVELTEPFFGLGGAAAAAVPHFHVLELVMARLGGLAAPVDRQLGAL